MKVPEGRIVLSQLRRTGKLWVLTMILLFLFLQNNGSALSAQPKAVSAQQNFLRQLLPLAENDSPVIHNPYYMEPLWKLWAVDPSPVVIDRKNFHVRLESIAEDNFPVPVFGEKPGTAVEFTRDGSSSMAGFYDDVYLSLDNGHSGLSYPPKDFFLTAGKMSTAQDYQSRFDLGVNFTSQSYAGRGRAIVDDLVHSLMTEKYFFFANSIRATPAHNSFKDTGEEGVTDYYDGLFSASFQSIGQSGSEVHALSKMMIAGASMPRSMKDLLKKNGAYAITLLTIFKMALPYADESGAALPFESELRHRPAYSSNGDPVHKQFCSANVHFYGYDEDLHLWEMARLAREMNVAPPVTILSLAGVQIKTGEGVITDRETIGRRIKSWGLTSIRFWGKSGESIEALIDLRKSYDLQGQDLRYRCQSLYPNQQNVTVRVAEPGLFLVTVDHDKRLPKGRIPIICTARNQGEIPGNPVFLNFYWPGEKELFDYGLSRKIIKQLGLKKEAVTVNRRPLFSMDLPGDTVACSPGDTVSVTINGVDPEGYPVIFYRRLGQRGILKGGVFEMKIAEDAENHIETVHFLLSDGTGGYTGRQLKLAVGKAQDQLEDGWATSLLGGASLEARVVQNGKSFHFQGRAAETAGRETRGLFAFRSVSGEVDMAVRIPSASLSSNIGLFLTNSLDYFSRSAYVGYLEGHVAGRMKETERRHKSRITVLPESFQAVPEFQRIVSRNGKTAVYVSEDAQEWTQLTAGTLKWFTGIYAGLLFDGEEVSCSLQEPSGELALISTGHAKETKAGAYRAPLKLTVDIPRGHTARYTLDGSEPDLESMDIPEEIVLSSPGEYTLRIVTYNGEKISSAVVAGYSLVK